jgi:hypothetical protein
MGKSRKGTGREQEHELRRGSMNVSPLERSDRVWEVIEAEKSRDRVLQRVSNGAWIVTFGALLFTAVGVGFNIWWAARAFLEGDVGLSVVFREAMPLVWVVGGISLLLAVLSTGGVLLRFRAASLDEIRLRLAAVEELLMEQADDLSPNSS